jgi:hypothetical protein
VSVFVALKESRAVTLEIHAPGTGTPGTPLITGAGSTRRIGSALHVCLVTASGAAGVLTPGKNYRYDLRLGTDRLASLLLLAGSEPLGYAAGELPSFALPPSDLTSLKLVHSSCRKPHGDAEDALPILDDIIEMTRGEPLARPHQLFLTGDQIYADDVSPPLLRELMLLAPDLLGWTGEEIPKGSATLRPQDVLPGDRRAAVKPPLTSSEADSHLMALGEFLGMYLYAWSDALWPASLPRFADLPAAERSRWALKQAVDGGVHEMSDAEREQIAAIQAADDYDAAAGVLDRFGSTVRKVRRALANVPTYMIFDDHEITDDWFLHQQARDDQLADAVGRRIVANGLAAFAVFQAWGNVPARFATGMVGETLLDKLETWRGREDATATAIRNAVGLGGTASALVWDFAITFPAHQLVVLDTRTRRGYPGGPRGAPDLLTTAEIGRQITVHAPATAAAAKPVTVVVSPAPVFGHPTHEWAASALGRVGAELFADREAWLVPGRRAAFEAFLAALVPFQRVVLLSGDVHYASTVAVEYWDERAAPERRAAFAQLTSSAAKNEDFKTRLLSRFRPEPAAWLGWPTAGAWLKQDSATLTVSGTPAVADVPYGNAVIAPPQWRYRARFCDDQRTTGEVGLPDVALGPASTWLDHARRGALAHREKVVKTEQYRMVVGLNNIGDVHFAASNDGARWNVAVFHRLWYRLGGPNDSVRPYTVHFAALLEPETADKPTPAEIASALPDLRAWADLLSFRPSLAIQTALRARSAIDWYVHPIERAWGQVNLDYYPVTVTALPATHGDPADLLAHVRRFLDPEFIDTGTARFSPYDGALDGPVWLSSAPVGAVIHIDMYAGGVNVDDGSVVVGEADTHHWRFSTVWTTGDFGHPVSGNREFGYLANADGSFTFYTRGADRTTAALDAIAAAAVFGGADALWSSFQQKLVAYVAANGGAATVGAKTWARHPWPAVSARYLSPSEQWLT